MIVTAAAGCAALALFSVECCDDLIDASIALILATCVNLTPVSIYGCRSLTDRSVSAVAAVSSR